MEELLSKEQLKQIPEKLMDNHWHVHTPGTKRTTQVDEGGLYGLKGFPFQLRNGI